MDVDEKDPDHLGSPDDEEWKKLVIDLGDSLERIDEENEVNRIKNKVVSDLIKEGFGRARHANTRTKCQIESVII